MNPYHTKNVNFVALNTLEYDFGWQIVTAKFMTGNNMDDKKLFLLDAYALIYRAYYALIRSPRITSSGRNTSAIFGFVNTLDDILRKENPPYMAVCFDPKGGHTFRHEAYPEYKAQRDKQPEDITESIPVIKDIIRARGIEIVEVERYEADDVIGTLARQAESRGMTTYMMTPDKDYGQLVSEHTLMYRPALKGRDFEIRGPQQICERYGIASPSQVIDLLALEGDASDNVPGCPGVGEKTAAKLIVQWGSVENLIAHADEIKGALGEKIRANIEQIRFSKFLVTIKTDVPLDISVDALRRGEADVERLREIYTELEFRSMLVGLDKKTAANETASAKPAAPSLFDDAPGGSLFGDAASPSLFDFADEQDGASDLAMSSKAPIANEMTLAEFGERAARAERVALAVLADGDEAMRARVMGVALSLGADDSIYIAADALGSIAAELCAKLETILGKPDVCVISHSLKRDILLLGGLGVKIGAETYDTSVAHYVLEPEKTHDLAEVAHAYASMTISSYMLSATERKKTPQGSVEQLAAIAVERAVATLALVEQLSAALVEQGQYDLFRDIEMPLVGVLARMEQTGVRIDSAELAVMSQRMTIGLQELEDKARSLACCEFNLASPAQVGEVLFGKMQIDPKAKRTKTGAFSTTEEILERYRSKYEIVDVILQHRSLKKLLATYIDALPRLVNPTTGKIHTTFNQTVTATGRLSSTNPNLQNIPVRTEQGREIRRAFIADAGDLILSCDYSQIELRLMAHMSGDEVMIADFNADSDIHRATAAKIFHERSEDVTAEQRRRAKTANFGIIYGISAFGLSERLGISRSEAKELIEGYLATYPGVKKYIDSQVETAREKLYVETVMGRRRYLPEINSRNAVVRGYAERNAVNAPLQGSAADIIKKAMIAIDGEISRRGMRSRMIMQVHDELVFNLVPEELDELKALVIKAMESAFEARVPLTVSAGVAGNWLEAH